MGECEVKKKATSAAVLEEILNELDAGRTPGEEIRKRGRAALRNASRSIKAATAAAAASGKSGRKATYDREAIKADIRDNPDKSFKSIADQFGCSAALVSILAKEVREEK